MINKYPFVSLQVLNLLVSHALTSSPSEVGNNSTTDQVLSLEEILAEGANSGHNGNHDDKANTTRLVKSQVCAIFKPSGQLFGYFCTLPHTGRKKG